MELYLTPASLSYSSQLAFAFLLLGFLSHRYFIPRSMVHNPEAHIGYAAGLVFWITLYLLLAFFKYSLLPFQTLHLQHLAQIPPALAFLFLLLFSYHYPRSLPTRPWEKPIVFISAGINILYTIWQVQQSFQTASSVPTPGYPSVSDYVSPAMLLFYLWAQMVLIRQTIHFCTSQDSGPTRSPNKGWRYRAGDLFQSALATPIFWITSLSFFLEFFYLLYLAGIPYELLKFPVISFDLDTHFAIFTLIVIYISSLNNTLLKNKLTFTVLLTFAGILGMTGWFLEMLNKSPDILVSSNEYLGYRESLHQSIIYYGIFVMACSIAIWITYQGMVKFVLIKPLDSLVSDIQRARNGDLFSPFSVTRQDEIGSIIVFLNELIRSLNDLFTSLEQRVIERTHRLSTLNEQLETEIGQRTSAEASLKSSHQRLSILYQISAAASHFIDLQDFLNMTLGEIMQPGFQEDRLIATLKQEGSAPDQDNWKLAAFSGIKEEQAHRMRAQIIHPVILDWVFNQAQPLIANLQTDQRFSVRMSQAGYRFLIVIPMRAGGKILGFLSLARKSEQEYSPEDISTLKSIAEQIGVVLHSKHQQEQARLNKIMEDRQILAQNLHDAVTQSVYSITMFSEAGKIQIGQGDADEAGITFQHIGEAARQSLTELRLFIHKLRPSILPEQGLIAALHMRLAAVEGRSGLRTYLSANEGLRFPAHVENECFFIAIEALNNILKHAWAGKITIAIQEEDGILDMRIEDDGCGFNLQDTLRQQAGMGLNNMIERAQKLGGTIHIQSTPDEGTKIQVRIPL